MSVDIRGLRETQAALSKLEAAPLKKVEQKATQAGVKALKPYVVKETPKRTGRMRKSVSAATAKRDRPASIVKFKTGSKGAWYRHFVIQGTKAHRIRFPDQKAAGIPKAQGNIPHPGAKANDIIGRAWASGGETAAMDAVDKVIDTYLESL